MAALLSLPAARSPRRGPGVPVVQAPSRISEADLLEQTYSIPTLHGSNSQGRQQGGHDTGRRWHGHGRSISHPFPTLFSGHRKKKQALRDEVNVPAAVDSTDEDSPTSYAPPSLKSLLRGAVTGPRSGASGKGPESDALTTGKCMTCETLVRWPKVLDVYRCTVCLTINDLKPVRLELGSDGQRRCVGARSGVVSRLDVHSGQPISLERTRRIVNKCIDAYLTWRIEHHDARVATGRLDAVPVSSENGYEQRCDTSLAVPDGQGDSTAVARSLEDATPGNRAKPAADHDADAADIFQPLVEYIATCFASFECVNASFSTNRSRLALRTASEGRLRSNSAAVSTTMRDRSGSNISALDGKTLMIGDIAENGSWWTGTSPSFSPHSRRTSDGRIHGDRCFEITNVKSPRIDWTALEEWYNLVLDPGKLWQSRWKTLKHESGTNFRDEQEQDLQDQLSSAFIEAANHVQRNILRATEGLLKRPGRALSKPDDLRFLLIILGNSLLYPNSTLAASSSVSGCPNRSPRRDGQNCYKEEGRWSRASPQRSEGSTGRHTAIIKRVLGLLANTSNECHHYLVSWFARLPGPRFGQLADLVGSFVTYRLLRQQGKARHVETDPTIGLVPTTAGPRKTSPAALHAASDTSSRSKKRTEKQPQSLNYDDDWQIKAAAKVMSIIFTANVTSSSNDRRTLPGPCSSGDDPFSSAQQRARRHGQLLPTSDFYNSLLDCADLIADFEAWELRRGKFVFCQYPFFLSLWAKIQILEHDARRQMEVKAREAFFDSIMTHRSVNQYLVLKIRRECLVEDSLKSISESVGSGTEEVKKGLRVEFVGEEGVDAGGLRKEWFLLLVRDVFAIEHGMFTYDDDSHLCYFNPHSFETSDQFFLVGVVLGLAIYNSTILDIALPPFAFRKLLSAGPAAYTGLPGHAKPTMTYSLEDLAQLKPALAQGLQQLLEFDGDVESTFCRDFVADVERYGQVVQIPLCPGGETRAVTNANRAEFVDLYIRYLLETAVARQFEPFKRGFFTVCGGNALSLFRPEEIELLIRGSDEPLDIPSLRAVSINDAWKVPDPAETEPVIRWFWESFEAATPQDQRKLLSFITGSDRIPSMGATSLVIKLSCLGDDSPRFPVARTCFNQISLWKYRSRQRLETMLWRAVHESEGFGIK